MNDKLGVICVSAMQTHSFCLQTETRGVFTCTHTLTHGTHNRYEKWGVVFEFYDALNTTDPTQTLRKPAKRDQGACTPDVEGPTGHCGIGGIREYNFCAGIALM
jgi:hypothetical protein